MSEAYFHLKMTWGDGEELDAKDWNVAFKESKNCLLQFYDLSGDDIDCLFDNGLLVYWEDKERHKQLCHLSNEVRSFLFSLYVQDGDDRFVEYYKRGMWQFKNSQVLYPPPSADSWKKAELDETNTQAV